MDIRKKIDRFYEAMKVYLYNMGVSKEEIETILNDEELKINNIMKNGKIEVDSKEMAERLLKKVRK